MEPIALFHLLTGSVPFKYVVHFKILIVFKIMAILKSPNIYIVQQPEWVVECFSQVVSHLVYSVCW